MRNQRQISLSIKKQNETLSLSNIFSPFKILIVLLVQLTKKIYPWVSLKDLLRSPINKLTRLHLSLTWENFCLKMMTQEKM